MEVWGEFPCLEVREALFLSLSLLLFMKGLELGVPLVTRAGRLARGFALWTVPWMKGFQCFP